MTGRHATVAELELYVLGGLDAARVDDFEAHCAECDSCAAALAGEAQLEVAFEQVARRSVSRISMAHPLRVAAYGAAGLLAMAAAMLLWFGHASAGAAAAGAGEGTASMTHHAMDDGAILDSMNDALDGG
jgi:anti-sigma factor RsiW